MSATGPDPDSYYGRPIIKEPTWTWEVPAYLFTGGIGGASAALSLAAHVTGRRKLERTSRLLSAAADAASLPLLVADLGRPERFLNMLRVVKPSSPMNVGSWILTVSGSASTAAAALALTGLLPRVRNVAETAAGLAGPALATYTGVLLADTAVPVWHEARRELPALFGASALATAGAAAAALAPADEAGPARRLAILGAGAELAAARAMERRLGFVGEVYRSGRAGAFARAARGLTAAGAGVLAVAGRRSRRATRAGAVLVLAGGLSTRWAVYSAGFASARDPRYTVHVQRERLRARE